MSSVTQTIPTLTGGLSQQPDELKIPGQVNVATNVIPDVTHGLLKRPGGKLLKSLSDDSTAAKNSVLNGKWFSYYRDETESYIGQVSRSGDINVWDCSNGNPVDVNYTPSVASALTTYLTHSNDEDIQTLTLNDYTFITNRTKTVAMSSTVEPARPPEVFIDLKATSYARQYAVNLFDTETTQRITTATRIDVELVGSSNNSGTAGGFLRTHATRDNIDDYDNGNYGNTDNSAGAGNDAYAPNVGTRIFDVTDNKEFTDENAVGGLIYNNNNPVEIGSQAYGAGTEYYYNRVATTSGTNFKYTIKVRRGSDNTTVDSLTGSSARSPKNLYFRIRTTGQSVPFTTGSGNDQTTNYKARYTTTFDLLYGGSGWEEGDYFFVWMKDGFYKITIKSVSTSAVQANLGLVRPNPTPFDTETAITAESILGDIRNGILGDSNGGVNDLYEFKDDPSNGYEVKIIGNGIYVTRPVDQGVFNITAQSSDLLRVMSNEVSNVDELPEQCKHGYVVKVANSAADEDDYYVKFVGKQKADGTFLDGAGVWEECAKPGDNIEFDKSTMPIQMVREANGTFTVSQVAWDNAEVGTTVVGGTNPRPSFVDNKINNLVFFRNRLVMLSDENVIMSRPGDFFNFWSKTATTFTPQDVIDLSCSSEYPAIVYDGIQINAGLLLFTKNQQFMLTTDSDILSPETAKINAVSSYNFNEKTRPVSLGTTVAFLDNANKFTRFFEMSNVLRQGEPDIVDQSKVISRLLDKDINIIAESRENSVIFFTKKGTKTIYGFRYFASGERRLLQAWFTWEVVGDIQYLCMLDDALYVVTRGTGNKDQMVKYSLKLDDSGYFISNTQETGFYATDTQETTDTDDDVIYKVHLDHMSQISAATYISANKETTFTKPNGYIYDTTQLVAYDIDQGFSLGRYQKVTVDGNNLKISGNWSGQLNTITVTNQGSGYTSAPTVAFSGGGGTEAAGTATVVDGKVTGIEITKTGMNYTSAPTITISGGGGSSATATATVNTKFVLGYLYEMDVQIPTLYVTRQEGTKYRADAKSSLIIHRVKFSFGPLGVYSTTINRVGKPDYTETTELGLAGFVEANRLPIVEEKIEAVPCYERNTNLKVNVKSSHPSPATLYSLAWEGDFTNRFYRRV